jgi:hypothetical protein
MMDVVAGIIIDSGLQGVGWGVMKGITLGRYRGFQPDDVLFEGTLGFITVSLVGYGVYRWLL